jgi:imidazolonepropionase-like amidohydrolase
MNTLLTFQNVTLIDGTGGAPLPDATVGVRDGKVVYAGKARKWQPTLEEDIINLELRGKYVLPGLIDCHVHLSGSGEPDSRFDEADDGAMALKILNNARKNLAAGITTLRDLGGWNELEFSVRHSIQSGEFTGPRMLLAGRFISISESGANHYRGMYRIADGVEEVRKAVREQIMHGADLVKLGVTGAVLVLDGVPGATYFNADEIRVAVEEAAKFGKRVAAHAHGIDGIRKAVQAGVHSIEHGTFLHQGSDVIKEMAKRGTYLVPTLNAGHVMIGADTSTVPEWIVKKLLETQQAAVKSLRAAHRAGVPIAMGSDAATPLNYHGENGLEVALMQQAGLKPMEALVAATSTAAAALGWEDRIGTLEEGKLADILVMDANPLDDLKRLGDKKCLRAVFQEGRLVARQPADAYPKTILSRDCLTVGQ